MKIANYFFLFLFITMMGCSGIAQKSQSQTFETMLEGLLSETVPYITCDELKELNAPVLLDARPTHEFEVSHLDGARCVGYQSFSKDKLEGLSKDDTIVVYCSVGYRSEKIGEQLQELGYKNVYNLYGSIFEWVNQGNEVVDDEGVTRKVHAYDKKWGQWLEKGEKVY